MTKTTASLITLSLLLVLHTHAAPALDKIAASQIGFTPAIKKQFSSPVQFNSFEIRRVPDDSTVFTGGAPVRQVVSSLIGGDTVWIGDFTSLTTPGRYKIVAGTMESYPFNISANVFDQPLRAVQRMFYYQRAFTAITMPYAEGPWVHSTDVAKAPAGVVKGWHDAGDYAVYMPTMTQTIFWMLEAWSDFKPQDDNTNIPESGNGFPDLLDEARWGIEWVKSMQDSNGGFWGSACPGCDNYSYAYGTAFPTSVGAYCKSIPPTVQNTAKAIAVLSYASVVYVPYDSAFANACISAAQSGWTWMVNNPTATNDGGSCNSYQQGSSPTTLKTNRMWAAAAMLYATGSPVYETAFQNDFVVINGVSSFGESAAFAGSLYLRVPVGANQTTKNSLKQEIFGLADGVRTDADAHPFQFATAYYWGCNSNGMHRSGEFSWRAYGIDTTRVADCDQALANLDYIFGRNIYNQCYVSGIDGVSKPRLRGFHYWMKALNTNPWHFPGALAGGPNQSPERNDVSYPNAQPYPIWGYWGDTANPRSSATPVDGRFTDNDSWSTNEIAINWNSPLLYNLYAARNFARKGTVDGVSPVQQTFPRSFQLNQNYPNPFNPTTTISYQLATRGIVSMRIYNVLGEEIARLVEAQQEVGYFNVEWNASNSSSGVYYLRMVVTDESGRRLYAGMRKLLLMK